MELIVEQVEVWAAIIRDKPGGLAEVLTALRDVGADLQMIVARRIPERPGEGIVSITPLQGDREIAAASEAGFNITQKQHCVRVMGANQPGVAALLTEQLAKAGINHRGFSASVIGAQFVAYVAADSYAEAVRAMEILNTC